MSDPLMSISAAMVPNGLSYLEPSPMNSDTELETKVSSAVCLKRKRAIADSCKGSKRQPLKTARWEVQSSQPKDFNAVQTSKIANVQQILVKYLGNREPKVRFLSPVFVEESLSMGPVSAAWENVLRGIEHLRTHLEESFHEVKEKEYSDSTGLNPSQCATTMKNLKMEFFKQYCFSHREGFRNNTQLFQLLRAFYEYSEQPVRYFDGCSLELLDLYSRFLDEMGVGFEPAGLVIDLERDSDNQNEEYYQACMRRILTDKLHSLFLKAPPLYGHSNNGGIKALLCGRILLGLYELSLTLERKHTNEGYTGKYSLKAADAEELMECAPALSKLFLRGIDLDDSFIGRLADMNLARFHTLQLNECTIERGSTLASLLSSETLVNLHDFVFPLFSECELDDVIIAIEAMGQNSSLINLKKLTIIDCSKSYMAVRKLIDILTVNEKFETLNFLKLIIAEPFSEEESLKLKACQYLSGLTVEIYFLSQIYS